MLMVIFGAGASYDSSPDFPPPQDRVLIETRRPPLATHLFDLRPTFVEALNEFRQCKTIVSRLRGASAIEAELGRIQDEAKGYARATQELAAVRCYLQRAIRVCEREWREATSGVTNQLSLLREIERMNKRNEPVLLVTFNYDTLLEMALHDLGLPIQTMDDYTDTSRMFQLFKLHGSINWGNEIESPLPANVNRENPGSILHYVINNPTDVKIGSGVVLCTAGNMGLTAERRPAFPAIAVPVEKKQIFQCPEQIVTQLKSQLPSVTVIFTIGWRATEEHFLALLQQYLSRGAYLCVVAGSPDDAQDTRVRICRSLTNNQVSRTEEIVGFTHFMRSRRAEELLASAAAG